MEENDLILFNEARLPVTQADITKPTKEFVINLITIFFNTFQIDGSAIKQPTLEQYDAILSDDRELYEEFIKIINMYAGISGISEKLFFKDLHVLDIASPTPKRAIKVGKFLANFIIYFRNKVSELQDQVNEIEEKRNKINDYIAKTKDAEEKIASSKNYREIQLVVNEQLKQEIEELAQKLKVEKNKIDEKKLIISSLEKKKAKNIEIYNTKKAEANRINNITSELRQQVVESPDKLNAQMEELEREKQQKIQEKELKFESLMEKKNLAEQRELTHSLVTKETDKASQILKIITDIKNFISKLDAIKKEKENTQETILKLEKNHDIEHNQCNDVNVNKIKKQMKNRLLPLHNQTTELLKNIKETEIEIAVDQESFCEISTKKNTTDREITSLEMEIEKFFKQSNELYSKEILSEINSFKRIMEFENINQ